MTKLFLNILRTYLYFKDIDTDADLSTTQKSVQALVNAIVIIAFIAAITFAVVILYKFNCMKVLQFLSHKIFECNNLIGIGGVPCSLISDLIGCSGECISARYYCAAFRMDD